MIQYPKNTHMTLPSIEGGFGTLNILRDPPKGIFTSYKPKVGDTNQITEAIEASSDRACENILVYQRGVNPMVSVNYSNNGSNGGAVRYQYGAVTQNTNPIHTNNVKLPYRVNREGSFRPPIVPPMDLLPLSRLPRTLTSQTANVGSELTTIIDSLTKCSSGSNILKSIKELDTISSVPNVFYNIDAPQPQTTLGKIREELASVCVSVNGKQVIERPVQVNVPASAIMEKCNYSARTNQHNASLYHLGLNTLPERGVNVDKRYSVISARPNKNVGMSAYDTIGSIVVPNKNPLIGCRNTNVIGNERDMVMGQENIVLTRNRPFGNVMGNKVDTRVDLNSHLMNRNVSLAPRSLRGGFENSGFVPKIYEGVVN